MRGWVRAMAGIGFELRKMFSESESTLGDLKAIAFSTIISVGPWIITAISLNILLAVAKGYIALRSERVLFMATVVYAFIFSQLLVSPWQYIVTRYVSDCIYKKKTHELRGAFVGIMKITIIVSFLVARVYLISSPLTLFYKGVGATLFTVLSASWVCMSFVSVLKNYRFVAYSYIAGNVLAVVLGVVLGGAPIEFTEHIIPTNLLLAYTLGILLTFLMLSYHLLSTFSEKSESEFAFLRYLKGYTSLFFIGLFYTAGVWVHLFVNWFRGDYYLIANTFRTSPFYEVALFYAFFITIPSMVYFVVFLETKFFPDYKTYYAHISYKGTMGEIERSLKNMMSVLKREMFYCMELQFFISLTFAMMANIIFYYFEMDLYLLELFRIFIFAAFCTVLISMFITIFLYFDARIEAMVVSGTFFTTNLLFTYILTPHGEAYTGLGFFLASFVTLIIAKVMLDRTIDHLSYITFYRENFTTTVGSPLLTVVEKFLNRKGYIAVVLAVILLGLFTGCTNYDSRGFNNETKHNWHTMSLYDIKSYDLAGYNDEGIDKNGFDSAGWHRYTQSPYDFYGFDVRGVNRNTGTKTDERGFNAKGFHEENNSLYDDTDFDISGVHAVTKTEYNLKGWTYYGLNKKTQDYYDTEGYSMEGYNVEGYDIEGYDEAGYSKNGWNIDGVNRYTGKPIDSRGFTRSGYNALTLSKYDERGFDLAGDFRENGSKYDNYGYNVEGIHRDTESEYNPDGWTYYGLNEDTQDYYDKTGYNQEGYNIHGYDKDGYDISGYNEKGYDKYGYDEVGYRENGWNRSGIYKYTDTYYDFYGFNIRGIHRKTRAKYDEYGWTARGINKETNSRYDVEGYDRNGINKKGQKRPGDIEQDRAIEIDEWEDNINIKTGNRYDRKGYSVEGVDKEGFNREGVYIGE